MFCLKFAKIFFVKISVCIITFNEEKNITRAVESVTWADEILVVDSNSTDKTREIAENLGARVVLQEWMGFARQKQFAVDNAQFDWILSLDADEQITPELSYEILSLKETSQSEEAKRFPLADGYKIARRTFYMNRWIRHSGWYPDWQLRLFNRNKGKWKDVLIHESVAMNKNAKVETLSGDILHYSIENPAYHHRLIGERYAPLAAEQMFQNGKRTTPLKIATAGMTAFFQTYVLKGGFLDGFPGFCIARFAAHHAFLKHLLLWEKQNNP